MPSVDVRIAIKAPLPEVWRAVNDIHTYPDYMSNVQSVEVLSDDGVNRISKWSVILKGSVLEWTEHESVDGDRCCVTFEQVDGDLESFSGHWMVYEVPGGVEVELCVDFEIGIPLLAEMLNPVAARALHDNSEAMLREIEREVAIAN